MGGEFRSTTLGDVNNDGFKDMIISNMSAVGVVRVYALGDADCDGLNDLVDLCTDFDGDGFGDPGFSASVCAIDNCPTFASSNQLDQDGDGLGNLCDNCVTTPNPEQTNTDSDEFGNACDNCPRDYNPTQIDSDMDGFGDRCDYCPNDPTCGCCIFPGDANDNGRMNISDITFLISHIFAGGSAPTCCASADSNGDGSINISDITFSISRIFADGPAPVCGPVDMTCAGP